MSSALSEGALVTYALDEIVETLSVINTMTDMAQHYAPPGAELQRSANSYWKPIEQQARDVDGWDLAGEEGGVIELSVSGSLGDPSNTYFELRADDMRDERSYRRRIRANAMRLAGKVEQDGLLKAATQGSFAVTNTATMGSTGFEVWDALAESESKMFDLEYAKDSGVCTFLNTTDYRAGGKDLTNSTANYRGDLPTDAYNKGEIQKQVAGINDVYRHNKLPMITAQSTAVTINGAQTYKPVATEASPNGSNVPFDNRFANLTVDTTVGVNVGDKFSVPGQYAVSRDGKIESDSLMTYTVAAVTDGTTLQISPRPYAWDERPVADGGSGVLTRDESAYANVNTAFNNADALIWLNTTAGKSNIIMTKDSMVLASSPIPTSHEMFSGMKTEQFEAGSISGIIGWQGQLSGLTGQCRIAIWYDWQVEKPEEVGIVIGGQV